MAVLAGIRKTAVYKLAAGQILSTWGSAFFWVGFVHFLLSSLFGMSPLFLTDRLCFQIAAWLVPAGWVLERRDAHEWPFNSPWFPAADRMARKMLSAALYAGKVILAALSVTALLLMLLDSLLKQ